MGCAPRRVHRVSRAVQQFVTERQSAAGRLGYGRADEDFGVVEIWNPESALHLTDDEDVTPALDLGVADPGLAAEIRPSNLEPDDVVRVMGDPHLVSLLVADPD